ncbi:gamma-glutamyltransferase family protein [Actinomadura madurae]|uniref:gamma-glutamyltransferase family protein n=1 Tax=Actinomadura madurae TaxID=1993 RepID=UPI002026C41D|nr:gamma-glutamyltransferase [Actinomadura madurae]MCP9955649.1 gamma-glutamyltransferase family protein [Actinomadura madurae]MCQ0003555.1 gamma-glutamyltransferase family protein [Actinomadura madurae]URN01096.1 gamma-glutamyltransferase family protein [Actinomadura madurae]
MCASTHWLASATAQSVLERGGNAFDAATAGAFVLHVAEPHLNGPGGDLVAVLATAAGSSPLVLAGQGHAPRGATIEHFRAEGLDHVPGSGALAAAVPGAVDSWLWLLAEFGTWELADVLAYAIHYAEHGVPVVPQLARVLATVEDLFRTHWPTSYALWMPGGRVPRADATLVNPEYARTLRRLSAAGAGTTRTARIDSARQTWRTGFVAEAVGEFAATPHRHSSGRDHAGVITAADFADFRPSVEPAVTAEFRGVTVAKAGLWSQGPVLLQCLTMLDHFDDEQIDPSSAEGIHTITEAVKLAMADREAFYGHLDPEDAEAVVRRLLSPRYSRERAGLICSDASTAFRPGDIGVPPYTPPLDTDRHAVQVEGVGEPTVQHTGETRGDTCHIDVVDRWGNIISATPSGGWLQSSPAVPGLGFALGTRLQMAWLDPAAPSRLEPGRRPRTTLTPTLVLRDGSPVAALGSPGGDKQEQWQLLYLVRTLALGLDPQEAIDAPAFHTTAVLSSFWPRTWTPRGLVTEERVGGTVIDELRERGHDVTVSGPWSQGRLSVVTRDPDSGVLQAAANSRGAQGYAAGR